MSNTRKLVLFLIYAAMISGGLYLLVAQVLRPFQFGDHYYWYPKLMLAVAILMLLGGYLMWVDFIAPALRIKTQEEAWEAEDEIQKRRIEDALRKKFRS
jgi:hypothetical protein